MKNTVIPSLALCLAFSGTTSAAVMSFDFTALVPTLGTPYDGDMISGTVTYEASIINPATPTEFYNPDASLTVAAFGQNFTDADDNEAGTFPVIVLSPRMAPQSPDGQWAFTFIVSESGGTNPVAINAPEITEFVIDLAPVNAGSATYLAQLTATTIPEAGTSLMTLLALFAMGTRRRR